jgi:hypothetical protein
MLPEEHARAQAVKSLNAWAETINGLPSVTPNANYVAFWNNVLNRSRHLPQCHRHLTSLRGDTPQESGKADLALYLMHAAYRLPIAFSVEVKAFTEASLSFDILRDSQYKWVETRGGDDYWIWLWWYPGSIPDNWRKKEDREKQRVWLVPFWLWDNTRRTAWDLCRSKSIRVENGKGARKELVKENISVVTSFQEHELTYNGAIWQLSPYIRNYLSME